MTDLPRSPRVRRGGRRPGWVLLTVLLVLAIAASSALVFTNRVELLKLAVILALWAAVVAAFVSVIYRRQSDADQAKVRDLKLVYDLQLDREISARREYELNVETQLRRELASELRAQAADEVAGLRAELAALRANLEILFDTDLSHRPAIETDRTTVRAYSDWARDNETTGRVSSSRIDAEDRDFSDDRTVESPIIDVPEEPHPPEPEWAPSPTFGGAHRRPSEAEQVTYSAPPPPPPPQPEPVAERAPEPQIPWQPPEQPAPPPQPEPAPVPVAEPAPVPVAERAPEPQIPWEPPEQPAPPPQPEPPPAPQAPPPTEWQPVPAEGQWIPAGAPGSNWVSPPVENGSASDYVGRRRAAEAAEAPASAEPAEVQAPAEPAEPQLGEDHAPAQPADVHAPAQPADVHAPAQPADVHAPAQPADVHAPAQPAMSTTAAESRRGRHSVGPEAADPGRPPPTLAAESPQSPPHPEPEDEATPAPPRHRSADDQTDAEQTGGQSVAELLARLQATSSGGGRRRRREE